MMSQPANKNTDPWFAIRIATTAQAEERLTADLDALGFSASEVRERPEGNELVIYVQATDMALARSRSQALTASLAELAERRGEQRDFLEVSVVEVASEDWTENWKKHFPRMPVGERLEILPPWEDPASAANGRTVVVINPGLAFGTGHHETTALCLVAVDRWVQPGYTVADIGCGSGILALAAAKLGAVRVEAVDIDPEAIDAAKENAVINGIGNRVRFSVADGPPDCTQSSDKDRFDLVLANIYAEKLVTMRDALTACVKPGGRLVLSGIESARRILVEDAFARSGWPIEVEWQRGEWVTVALVNRQIP